MYIRVRPGLTRGSIFLAVILGIGTGFYIWKPMFDPAEKHKLAKYEKPSTSGNEWSISLWGPAKRRRRRRQRRRG